jgi:hypothetical protein
MHWTTIGELPTGFQHESSYIILSVNKTTKQTSQTPGSLPSLSKTRVHQNHHYTNNENTLYNRLFNSNNLQNNGHQAASDSGDETTELRALYECTHNNWLSNFVSTQPNCDGKGRMIRQAGFVYASEDARVYAAASPSTSEYAIGRHSVNYNRLTLNPLYKCHISDNKDFYVSSDSSCEQSFARRTQLIGYYVLSYNPIPFQLGVSP